VEWTDRSGFGSLIGPSRKSNEWRLLDLCEGLTAAIVEISARRLSRRLMVVLVAGRVVSTHDDIRH
jgi:hypothetical protein